MYTHPIELIWCQTTLSQISGVLTHAETDIYVNVYKPLEYANEFVSRKFRHTYTWLEVKHEDLEYGTREKS